MIKTLKALLLTIALVTSCAADEQNFSNHFFYVGGMSGNADADWSSVVGTDISTLGPNPLSADGNGMLFGLDAGYQFSPHFAIEGEFIDLPSSKLVFESQNDYHAGKTLNTTMLFAAIVFKVIAPLPNSKFSVFVDAGPAYQYLHYPHSGVDVPAYGYAESTLGDIGTWAPTFGGGLLYRINNHWQAEGSFQYAPGTGRSVQNPMNYYVPEIYAGTFKLDYIF